MDQQRLLDVFLDDRMTMTSLASLVLGRATILHHVGLDLFEILKNFDSVSSVRRFAWLEDPNRSFLLGCRFERLELRVKFEVGRRRDQVSVG